MWRQAIIEALDGTHPTIGPRIALVIYGLIVPVGVGHRGGDPAPALSPQAHATLIAVEFTILAIFAVEYILRLVLFAATDGLCVQFLGDRGFHRHRAGGPVPVSPT